MIMCIVGQEGRACMVAIVDEQDQLDLVMLHKKLQEALPPYARPLFIRILKKLDTTGMTIYTYDHITLNVL